MWLRNSGGAEPQIRHTAPSFTDSRPRESILAVTHGLGLQFVAADNSDSKHESINVRSAKVKMIET